MNILVLNAGSSSQKTCLYGVPEDAPDTAPEPLWESNIEWKDGDDRPATIRRLLRGLWEGEKAVLGGPSEINAVGHRVVHGGAEYRETTRLTAEIVDALRQLAPLAPAHNPAAVEGIESVTSQLGDAIPQFAVFDTAFHRTLPDAAAIYPGPYDWFAQGIRRYGFHGISHQYVSGRAARLLGRPLNELRLITCHLGNGCSLCAVKNGISVDTTMGFTPLDGLMMGTRSGSIDPGLLFYLQREQGKTADELDTLLNKQSGLKGVSGISGDMRTIEAERTRGNERAQLAFDTFSHRLRWHIGAMLPALGGLDALVFTAGIGEHSAAVRAAACADLSYIGLRLDTAKNDHATGDTDIAAADSPVRILVVQTEEDWAIARECEQQVNRR